MNSVRILNSDLGMSPTKVSLWRRKNIIHSAKVAELTRRAAEFGVVTGPIMIDMAGVRGRKRQMVDGLIFTSTVTVNSNRAEL
jgi:hypothetical protein